MVLTPSSSSSPRLSLLRRNTNAPQPRKSDINDLIKQFKPLLPHQQHSATPEAKRSSVITNKPSETSILDGVIAYLDVRTEDGDDVSVNFERALQSMGAKTRRYFSESVTHLIFKNGSPATLKKALGKSVFIINLLWISRCKQEGKRLPEKDFLIERPQGLVLTGKKRRKSMEPSKVRALDESSPTSSGSECVSEFLAPVTTKHKEQKKSMTESEIRKKDIEEAEEAEHAEFKPPLPIKSVESIANRRDKPTQNTIPVNAPDTKVQKQIKARFSIGGQQQQQQQQQSDHVPEPPSIPSPITKKRRRLTANPSTRPAPSTVISDKPRARMIVLTSMLTPVRKQCEEAIKKLGQYQIGSEVTEDTTHVLVGVQRRTSSVILGLLRGVWIVSPDWLIQSAKKGAYLPEKGFERLTWYPRADLARSGLKLLPESICISVYSSTHGVEFIKELVQLTGALLVEQHEEADIVLCSDKKILALEKNRVSETWLFDSIEQWRCNVKKPIK